MMNEQDAHQTLAEEIRTFSAKWQLTPRESEIVGILSQGIVRIKDIAAKLGLSPNTVNNHVNSIFAKTQTRSKSELLATLLESLARELYVSRQLMRSPRVLVLDGDPIFGETLSEYLHERGMKVRAVTETASALESLREGDFDFLVAKSGTPGFDPFDCVRRLRASQRYSPQLILTSDRLPADVPGAMAQGAVEILEKPLDLHRLYATIMGHFAERVEDRLRYLAPYCEPTSKGRVVVMAAKDTLGTGGVYVSESSLGTRSESLRVGDKLDVEIRFESPDETVVSVGQVVWVQESPATGRGAGIRCFWAGDGSEDIVARFVRRHSSQCYIPCGPS